MTRISKLYDRFDRGSALDFAEFIRLIEAFGFTHRRTTGSHRIYARDDVPEQVNVQPKGKELKPYQRKQFRDIIARYDLRLDDDV
jgi:predicted RNA binding protein YcfA (HicA-like mRNA interferase family)